MKARLVTVAGQEVIRTPLALPSYSSRAIPPFPLRDTFEETIISIASPILVSAYDVFHEKHTRGFRFDEALASSDLPLVFLDSGGYEALWNLRAREAGLLEGADAQPWTLEHHDTVLKGWPPKLPMIAVTYDNAAEGALPIEDQLARAHEMAQRWPQHGCELLLKPPPDENFLTLRSLRRFIPELAKFSVIGVTEKECGASMGDRVRFIHDLRSALSASEVDLPIHVFGGLDPYMTPLYFLAGADIFDGLTWLKYAFHGGRSLYSQGFVARELPLSPITEAEWEMRHRNYREIADLQIALARFAISGTASALGPEGDHILATFESCVPHAWSGT